MRPVGGPETPPRRSSSAQALVVAVGTYVPAEFGSCADVKLAVDARQVGFDRFGADKQCRGDVTVGHARGCELPDSPFGGCEGEVPSWCDVDACEFGTCAVGPQRCAYCIEGLQCLAESCSGSVLLALTALQLAEPELGAGAFERH